ncbi:cell division protein PerM, partial [Streptomyces meridianus]
PRLPVPPALRRQARRLPLGVRTRLPRRRLLAAGRAAAAGTAALVGGGALLVAASLAWHGTAARQSFPALSQPWPGRLALFLLALALVPNAAVWAASYGLGAGFALGGGCTTGLPAAAGCPVPAAFPLLAAVPQGGHGDPLVWGAAAVPLAAGLTAGWFTARSAVDRPGSAMTRLGTVLTGLLAALGCGAATALLARWAGGPLGTGALARFGPDALATGAAATVTTALIGVISALVLREWWLGRRGEGMLHGRSGTRRDGRPAPVESGAEPWSVWEVGTTHRPGRHPEDGAEPWWRLWERPAGRAARKVRKVRRGCTSGASAVMPEPRTAGDAPLGLPDGRGAQRAGVRWRPGRLAGRTVRLLRSVRGAAIRRFGPGGRWRCFRRR